MTSNDVIELGEQFRGAGKKIEIDFATLARIFLPAVGGG